MNDTAKYQALQALYARLPKLECQRKCQECCGPVTMTRLEMRQLTRANPKLKWRLDKPDCGYKTRHEYDTISQSPVSRRRYISCSCLDISTQKRLVNT